MICFPLDNTEYEASALGAWFATRTRGVFAAEGNLAVSAAVGMAVSVSPGLCWVKMDKYWGVCALQKDEVTLNLPTADTALPRIDLVCAMVDKNLNKAQLVIKKGVAASVPQIAPPVRDINRDEIYLASIYVPAGAISVLAKNVSDQRLNESYCGLMRDGVTSIPTAQLQAQAEAVLAGINESGRQSLAMIAAELARLNASTEVMLKTEFSPNATAAMANGGQELRVTSELVRTGTKYDVRFMLPTGYSAGVAVYVDNVLMSVRNNENEAVALEAAAGAVVTATRWGGYLFPRGWGGLKMRVFGGGSRPASPKKGDIWLQNAVIAGKVHYGVNPPTSPAKGQVWLQCKSDSPYYVQPMANIMMPVDLPQIYTNGVWAAPHSEIFWGGAWLAFAQYTYYYQKGNEQGNPMLLKLNTACSMNKTAEYIELACPSKLGGGVATSTAPVNMSGISKLVFSVMVTGTGSRARVNRIGTSMDATNFDVFTAVKDIGADVGVLTEVEVDVGALVGNHYIKLQNYDTASMRIYAIKGR